MMDMSQHTPIYEVPLTTWRGDVSSEAQKKAQLTLESGGVLLFKQLPFELQSAEQELFEHPLLTDLKTKNVSYDHRNETLKGTFLTGAEHATVQRLLHRYGQATEALVHKLCTTFGSHLTRCRTSWRPVEIEGRVPASWRKDDRRLHVDAFPASPTQGSRILRVFTNIHPNHRARIWHVGEGFDCVAERFFAQIPRYYPVMARLLKALRVTRGLRTEYDHQMLALHDLMKEDQEYQRTVPKTMLSFEPGMTWITFTDQCSHAALAGQHALEQTFSLAPAGLLIPESSPRSILETMKNPQAIGS